jgi:hypothetical protein
MLLPLLLYRRQRTPSVIGSEQCHADAQSYGSEEVVRSSKNLTVLVRVITTSMKSSLSTICYVKY